MSSISLPGLLAELSAEPEDKAAPPPPPPKPGPVLIHDAVTPVRDTTLLALLLKRWDRKTD